MLTAEYGGTGGKQIEPGMVVEEPDIEIGAGVSSKGKHHSPFAPLPKRLILSTAISRRMQTDKGGHQGPRSTRDGLSNEPQSQQQYMKSEHSNRDVNNIGVAPAVPAFGVMPNGFQFPGMPNGFQFQPGFPMPTSTTSQPPPPGAS
jgi:protein NRD1